MIRNFLFHRVSPERDIMWDPMDVGLFEKCIRFMVNSFEVVQLEELLLADNYQGNNKMATIGFDDGYKDNFEYALPILEKYNCKASFYVVTDCIDNNALSWTHKLEFLFQNTQIKNIELGFDFLPTSMRINSLPDRPARVKYGKKIIPLLKKLEHRDRLEIFSRIEEAFQDVEMPEIMMSWDHLREMQSAGHYIGSHSVSHPVMAKMTNTKEIENEMRNSGERIQEMLGYFPVSFAYPFGSYHAETIGICKEAGYKFGLAVKQDVFLPHKDDLFEIPRIELYNEPWFKTKLRITHQLEKFKRLTGYRKN